MFQEQWFYVYIEDKINLKMKGSITLFAVISFEVS